MMSDEPQVEQTVDEPAVQEPEPAVEPQSPADSVEKIVEDWWNEHVRGSVVGRSTEAWNHLQSAKEILKEKLRNLKS